MNRRGFTIVELLIIIAVLGVLLTLGVVNLRGTQASARDEERRTDVESIALHLETFYKSGSDQYPSGSYPPTVLMSSDEETVRTVLRDINSDSLRTPGVQSPDISLIPATSNTENPESITPYPSISEYVYQPLQANGNLCTLVASVCRKFNIYYFLETDETVQVMESKNR